MKEFYVLNLDMRRIAILAGGALTALGLTLFIGMAIGRGQGERNQRLAAEESDREKLGLEARKPAENSEKLVAAAGPSVNPQKNNAPEIQAPAATVAEAKAEIPVREDPLVAGPPKKAAKKSRKVAKSAEAERDESERPAKKRKAVAKAKTEPEVSGRVEHAAQSKGVGRYTIQVAAFKRSSEANSLIEKLKGEGLKARSEHAGDYYLVTVGRAKSKEKLEKALARLKELEYEAYIRKIKSPSEDT